MIDPGQDLVYFVAVEVGGVKVKHRIVPTALEAAIALLYYMVAAAVQLACLPFFP
jgi:hypothetical protein